MTSQEDFICPDLVTGIELLVVVVVFCARDSGEDTKMDKKNNTYDKSNYCIFFTNGFQYYNISLTKPKRFLKEKQNLFCFLT